VFDAAFWKQLEQTVLSPALVPVLATQLALWSTTGKIPVTLIEMKGITSTKLDDYLPSLEGKLTSRVVALTAGFQQNPAKSLKVEVTEVLQRLETRGILTLLGFQFTAGSVDMLPPCTHHLIQAFMVQHNEPTAPKTKTITYQNKEGEIITKVIPVRVLESKLTVGGRAYCKHRARSACQFWGYCEGSDAAKNAHALLQLKKVLSEAVWYNIHMLPGELPMFEIRVQEGYGMRFGVSTDETRTVTFRGFLEAYMEDGHKYGWKNVLLMKRDPDTFNNLAKQGPEEPVVMDGFDATVSKT
jgi:hypothetical protein